VRPRVAQVRHERRPADGADKGRVRYRVRPGDTLSAIAARYGTTVEEIKTWNNLSSSRIAAGGLLTIYTVSTQD
jgi:membrane-bound lytic murein transglycosylase D